MTLQQRLEQIAAGHATIDLIIVYSDMHGLWGGVTATLSADGSYERLERGPGMRAPDLVQAKVTMAQVQSLVRLLLEIEAWEQRMPVRMLIPDEVVATLALRSGDIGSSIWESYNELVENDRIVRVRDLLIGMANA